MLVTYDEQNRTLWCFLDLVNVGLMVLLCFSMTLFSIHLWNLNFLEFCLHFTSFSTLLFRAEGQLKPYIVVFRCLLGHSQFSRGSWHLQINYFSSLILFALSRILHTLLVETLLGLQHLFWDGGSTKFSSYVIPFSVTRTNFPSNLKAST